MRSFIKQTASFIVRFTVHLTATLVVCSTGHSLVLSNDVIKASQDILSLTQRQSLQASACKTVLTDLNNSLYGLKSDHFKNMGSVSSLDQHDAISRLFEARMQLNYRLRDFLAEKKFQNRTELEGCANEMRKSHRSLRGLEDRIGLTVLRLQKKLKNLGLIGLPGSDLGLKPFIENQWPNLLVNRNVIPNGQFNLSDLKNGDYILTRGTTFASTVISRISEVDSQFSHIGVVYIDDGSLFGEKNKDQVYVVEAEPDYGLQIVSLNHFLQSDKNRLVVYRYKSATKDSGLTPDAEIAARAAKFLAEKADVRLNPFDVAGTDTTMADRLQVLGEQKIKRITYNFEMDMHVESSLFCSQAISYALQNACLQPGVKCEMFAEVGNTQAQIFPLLQSKISIQKNGFAKLLKLKASETFSPADVEVEPRFEVVAEWRDFSFAAYTRVQDIAMTKIFQLMETYGYEFIETAELKVFTEISSAMLKKADKMPENMPEGLTKGSLYMAFLTWYTGPGSLISNTVESLNEQKIIGILKSMGLSQATITEVNASGAHYELSPQKLKKLLVRILKQKSLVSFVQDLEDYQINKTGFYLTESQMSNVIDEARKQDCLLYQEMASTSSTKAVVEKTGKRTTLFMHDLVRKNQADPLKACEVDRLPLDNF